MTERHFVKNGSPTTTTTTSITQLVTGRAKLFMPPFHTGLTLLASSTSVQIEFLIAEHTESLSKQASSLAFY